MGRLVGLPWLSELAKDMAIAERRRGEFSKALTRFREAEVELILR